MLVESLDECSLQKDHAVELVQRLANVLINIVFFFTNIKPFKFNNNNDNNKKKTLTFPCNNKTSATSSPSFFKTTLCFAFNVARCFFPILTSFASNFVPYQKNENVLNRFSQ
jgi:hypothetical protein